MVEAGPIYSTVQVFGAFFTPKGSRISPQCNGIYIVSEACSETLL